MKKLTFVFVGILCSLTAAAAFTFGIDGRDGMNGMSGQNGMPGSSAIVQATGSPQSLNLSGGPGGDARDGQDGDNAWSCVQGRPTHDLVGANGGDGGDGGSGGRGGDTGFLQVYYENPGEISKILVQAAPGRGGLQGRAGRSGRACHCTMSSWTIPGPNGTAQTFRCRDGMDGRMGRPGLPGPAGRLSEVALVPQLSPIPQETPEVAIPMQQILDGTVTVSRNLWTRESGARALFAPGSVVRDDYLKYQGLRVRTASFLWQAARPLAAMGNQNVMVRLNPAEPAVFWPEGLWIDAVPAVTDSHTTFAVQKALLASDATKLSIGTAEGSDESLDLPVIDSAAVSDLLQTKVHLRYSTLNGAFGYQVRYDGDLAAEDLTIEQGRITLHIGKLVSPIYTKPGRFALAELVVTRSLGGHSARIALSKSFKIQ